MTHYKPPFFLRNGHLATVFPALSRKIQVPYIRKRIITPDHDFFDADVLKSTGKKALVIMHGLEGSSHSAYVQGMARLFHANEYSVHAINFRSCSGETNRLLTSYHSGFTADVRFYVKHLIESHQAEHIYLCGFSLGGNAMLKYLAQEGAQNHICAAAAVSVPVDLKGSAMVLSQRMNTVYMKRFLKSLVSKITGKAKAFPGKIDLSGIEKIRDFKEFDDRFTAPIHGFKNADDYWANCSSLFVLDQIKTPTLLLNAKNDPFLSESCFPPGFEDGKHPFVHAEYPAHGGHVGFANASGEDYWSEQRVLRFFKSVTEQ